LDSDIVRWGTFCPDENGWIGHHTALNDAHVVLPFEHTDNGLEFMGYFTWDIAHNMQLDWNTPEGLRSAFLMHLGTQEMAEMREEVGGPFNVYYGERGVELREQILEQIGGLAFNLGYQFVFDSDPIMYGLITGWRPFESVADMQTYIPQLNLPETIGDFTLREITVDNGTPFNSVRVSPWNWTYSRGFVLHDNGQIGLPIGQVFTLYYSPQNPNGIMPVFAFHAHYENSSGQHIGLSVWRPIGTCESDNWRAMHTPFSTYEIEGYGTFHFRGYHFREHENLYHIALYGDWDIAIVMGFRYENWQSEQSIIWNMFPPNHRHSAFQVEQHELEALVRLFNPAQLAETFNWRNTLTSMQ
jgi:hypothetical protein